MLIGENVMFDQSVQMRTIKVLENALDTTVLRQKVIGDNIANVNTPGFKKSYVTFEYELSQALQKKGGLRAITTNPRHIQFGGQEDPTKVKPRMYIEHDTVFRNDLNNVDINVEMSDLAKNSVMNEALINRVNQSLQMLQTVIRGGGR